MTKKQRAGNSANCPDSSNQFDIANIKHDFEAYYSNKFENLPSSLTNVLTAPRPPKIIRLKPCGVCKKAYVPKKMSEYPKVCFNCLVSAQTKPIRERRRFFDATVNNFQKLLRGTLAL